MPISRFYQALRQRTGPDLLLMPGVAAVVHDARGWVLIQQRPDGVHSLPAGATEPGEQPARAVVREVREETGLIVRPTLLLGVFGGEDYRTTYANGDTVEYLVCLFACEIVAGELRCLDGESASTRFWPPEAVPVLGTEYPRRLFIRGAQGPVFEWDESWQPAA